MMQHPRLAGLLGAMALTTFAFGSAEARPLPYGVAVPPGLVEPAQCRTVRERIVRPNGRVVYRTVRRCSPRSRVESCRVVRERVVRPNGTVVFRTVRRCSEPFGWR
jgi:hypothetical protein